jgi:hypothetical protein
MSINKHQKNFEDVAMKIWDWAEVMADTAQDIFKDPSVLKDVKTEYQNRVEENFQYVPLLGDRDPHLDYRNYSINKYILILLSKEYIIICTTFF